MLTLPAEQRKVPGPNAGGNKAVSKAHIACRASQDTLPPRGGKALSKAHIACYARQDTSHPWGGKALSNAHTAC